MCLNGIKITFFLYLFVFVLSKQGLTVKLLHFGRIQEDLCILEDRQLALVQNISHRYDHIPSKKHIFFDTSLLAFLCRLTLLPASVHICVSLGAVSEGPLQPAPDGCSAAASTWATESLRSGQSGAPQGTYTAGLLPLRTGRVQGK